METKKVTVCYSGSGVKSLRVLSTIFIWLAAIGLILILLGFFLNSDYDEDTGKILLIVGAFLVLQGCLLAAILRGLATIAETALIKKHIILKEYEIVEPVKPKW
jgi:uncharacterized membrane protein